MPRLELRGIRKTFRGVVALDDVDLEVEDGEYLVILGPTGAGKTTLLRVVAGLLRPDRGTLSLDGQSLEGVPPEERGIAYLPQTYSLFNHLTLWDNATFGPVVRGWPPRRVESIGREMLDLVRLFERRAAYPRELSGGMQQRAALSRALATTSGIFLLDEPLRALDARLRIELRQELKDLATQLGITTLHVTHDQEEALGLADRILVLRNGQVRQVARPQSVYEEPEDPFVAHFVGEANFFEGTIVDRQEGVTTVRLRNGRRVVVGASNGGVGEGTLVGVKIDRSLLSTNGGGENALPARIRRVLFAGKRTTLEVELEGLEEAKVKMSSARAVGLEEGQRVTFSFPSQYGRLFGVPGEGLAEALEVE